MSAALGLLNKYRLLSKPKKATLWITICSFLQRGIGFLTVPIFTRLMSTTQYGEFSVYQSWEQVAFYAVTLGVTYGGFNTAMMKYEHDRQGYTASALGLSLCLSIIWIGISLLLGSEMASCLNLPVIFLYMLFVEVLARGTYDIWISRLKFDFEYKKIVPATMAMAVLTPAVGVALVIMMQGDALARILSFVIVESAVALFGLMEILKGSRRLFKWEYWAFTLRFNVPLLPHYFSMVVLMQSDKIMINAMCSTSEVGIYAIAYSIGMLMTVLSSSLSSSLVPWMYRRIKEAAFDAINRFFVIALISIAAAVLVIDLLSPEIVAIMAPADYREATRIIPVIAASVLYIFAYTICSNIEFYYEKNVFATIASIVAALLNILLNYLFIPLFGYEAAGYTTFVCYVVLAAAHFVFANLISRKNCNRPIIKTRPILGISGILVLASFISILLYLCHPVVRYCLLALLLVVCAWKRKSIIELLKGVKL